MIHKLLKKVLHLIISFQSENLKTTYLGSEYGGWYILDTKSLINSVFVSGGVGEDISFDIEFINKYDSTGILIDPTPRSKIYIDSLRKNFGNKKTTEYSDHGYQKITSYNLQNINNNNLKYLDFAMFNKENTDIKFYPPSNKEHVSYSISNWQNSYNKNMESIVVKTITLKKIIENFQLSNIELLKLDIEGAETKVIPNMLKEKIFPNQILVEFDELRTKYIKPYLKVFSILLKLKLIIIH